MLQEFISVIYITVKGRKAYKRANWVFFFEKPAMLFNGHALDVLTP